MMQHIKTALLSVSDKKGIVEFAHALESLNIKIHTTGGTAKKLIQAEVKFSDVSELTGFPEILDGRVKTLHPHIFGGILALREKPSHQKELAERGIEAIDLVCVNLYPFETVMTELNLSDEDMLEYIDIGGVTLLRAAAKNYQNVVVICDPQDYERVIEELRSHGRILAQTRIELAAKAFAHTTHYDSVIAVTLGKKVKKDDFSTEVSLGIRKISDLRYGENPHQKASLYKTSGMKPYGVAGAKIHQGKAISFNNYLDCDAAWRIVATFTEPTCAIIKHSNPCGSASGMTSAEAFRYAYACDSLSAFGGIIGFNRTVDAETAQEIEKSFFECVIAPGFSPKARDILSKKEKLRLLEQPTLLVDPYELDWRQISGGFLVQEPDQRQMPIEMNKVTRRSVSPEETISLAFAWNISKFVKSNAIILARGQATVGVGAGQMSRIDALKVAIMKMRQSKAKMTAPLVMASDGFITFRDVLDEAAQSGVSAVIQPGGSIRDKDVIDAANQIGLAMIHTGVRHFRH